VIDEDSYADPNGCWKTTRQLIGCLHDPTNVQQTYSKCIQNTRELVDVCWKFAGSCKRPNTRL